MPNILVRDVSPEVHSLLQKRAEESGQSLQQYLAGELGRLAERPTLTTVLSRIRSRSGGRVGLEQAVEDLRGERRA